MDNNIKNESRESNTKTNTRMVSGNVHYNADTTCITGVVLFSMCDTSMGGDIQVVYNQ